MNKYLFGFLVVLVSVSASCSNNNGMKDTIVTFKEKQIVLPEELVKVESRNISTVKPEKSDLQMIIYYDSLECSSCKVSHLKEMQYLYELSDKLPMLEVYTIFSPRQQEYDQTMVDLMMLNYPYPIYVDKVGSFQKNNHDLPKDKRFHSFLLDKTGHPVFVGNPTASDKLWNLFMKVLDNLQENDGVYIDVLK